MGGYIIAILIFLSSYDGGLLKNSKQQSSYYLTQIRQQQNEDIYLWALATLYQSSPEVQNYIIKQIRKDYMDVTELHPFLYSLENHADLLQELALATSSADLLLACLLINDNPYPKEHIKVVRQFKDRHPLSKKNGIDYPVLVQNILSKTTITEKELPLEELRLVHLLFFYDTNFKLINKAYAQQAFQKALPHVKYSSSLKNSLHMVTLFRIYYLNNQLQSIKNLEPDILADSFFPNSDLKLYVHRLLDYSMYRLGYYDVSLDISRNYSVPLAQFLDDKKAELQSMISQGAYLIQIGNVEKAQQIYLQILQQINEHNININPTTLFNNLGITYVRSGEFDKYLDLQLKALNEAEKTKNYHHQLNILTNLYIYYQNNKDPNSALSYLEKSIELARTYGNQEDLGVIYLSMANFYRKLEKNYSLSKEYFEKARNALNKNNQIDRYLNLLFEEGQLYVEMGKLNLALKNFDEISSLSPSKTKNQYFEALVNKTAVQLQMDQLDKASDLITKITSYDFSNFDFEDIIKAKTVQAGYLIKTGKPEEARSILEPAIEQTVAWAKNSTNIQAGFWNIEPEFLDAFQLTTDLFIETGKEEEAVEVLDKLKTINDASLYQNPMVKSSLLDETELSQYQRLTGQLDALRKKQLLASEKEQLSLQSSIDRLSAQKRMLDRKISGMVDRESVSVNEVQRQLAGREMVLHITELNDWYYMAKISRTDVRFDKIKLDSTLRAQFTGAIENLAAGKTDINELSRISSVLDLGSLPSWVNTLTIIPDSYLYQLPVDVLPLNKDDGFGYSYGEATYIVERFKTHYLTSLNDFRPADDISKDYKWDFVGYGVSGFPSYTNKKNLVPLPYAESEVANIVDNLTNFADKTAYLDSASSERTFKETASNARIIHLATHSELSERDPLFSTIYMSPGISATQEDDFSGQIFAYELFELNLANDLIMLNSCDSGSGSYLQGSGVMGISRALRYAGASSLILNLWSVNDMMASDFAIEFYKNINEGQSKDEALRQTKLHFLKNKNANPHYWGPYMLIGDREPLVRPYRETNIYFAASFMLFFITIASFSLIKEWKKKAA